MFPYADDTKSFSPPLWILILVLVNVLVFVMSYTGGENHYIRTIFSYGTIPARFFTDDASIEFPDYIAEYIERSGVDPGQWALPVITLFTAMFLHGGIFHIFGNMWFLWLFGDNVEDRLGKLLFPIFYILCGVIAGIIHVLFEHDSTLPAVGASGAIAGVMGAYIYLFPNGTIRTLISWGLYFRTTHVPASLFLGLWFILQLFGGFAMGASNVAFMAHIGGFVGGLALAFLFNKLNMITWYPGDRGYSGLDFMHKPARELRTSTYTSPISAGPTYTGDIEPGSTPSTRSSTFTSGRKRKRRYTWRE